MGAVALRLLLFIDPELSSSVTMLVASLRMAEARGDIEIAAIIDTARHAPSRLRLPRALAAASLRGLCNLNTAAEPTVPTLLTSWPYLARRRRIPVLAPRERGVNDASFVEALRRLRPDAGLALMVTPIFRAPLLAAINGPINYHNGLLPHYRGVAATGWSIYEGAACSGFSFHRMTADVDWGPILLQGAVPVREGTAAGPLERAKTQLAAAKLDEVFDLIDAGAAGSAQPDGSGSSFSRTALQAICTVEEPRELTLEELELRLRAFEILHLTLTGRRWSVTALRRITRHRRDQPLAFRTADGVWVEPTRIMHLPPSLYRSLKWTLPSA